MILQNKVIELVGWAVFWHAEKRRVSYLKPYNDVTMSWLSTMVYQRTVCSGAGERKHKSSASLAFDRGIHRWSVNSPHKGPVMRKIFPFDDVTMNFVYSLSCTGATCSWVWNAMWERVDHECVHSDYYNAQCMLREQRGDQHIMRYMAKIFMYGNVLMPVFCQSVKLRQLMILAGLQCAI